MLDTKTRDVIKATIPVLETHGEQITKRFYEMLFDAHPELLNIFNHSNQREGRQQTALANAVYAAAVHIDNLESILPAVKQISHKHRGLGIQPEHYPIVGQFLLRAIKDVLGDAATDEIIQAWADAYGAIASAFIGVEQEMYEEAGQQPGGWTDFRPFVVSRKVRESDVITSFYLTPKDGEAISSYRPGQYLTLKVSVPGQAYTQMRQYSLSDTPGKPYYRISVKREDARENAPAGLVSNYLHNDVQEGDTLLASAPSGDFMLVIDTERPVVFLSGGVGMTPLMSMVSTLLQRRPKHHVTYVHAALHGGVHAFKSTLEGLADEYENTSYYAVYERPSHEDKAYRHFAKEGFVDADWLRSIAPLDAEFYFCGPVSFMKAVYRILKGLGVDDAQIHYEFFGPQGSLA
ncbi:NO-inducible flavohemoprotein [Alicyclobacillus fastidiosus]|uniref:Flavohemoprotein n=1 Tax=Alicyclobacillus fastidiosus TaxID=392011 RepID=A0ABY6ZK50_9BACL|nr:NO-inducible flavohemoprotein [Alicyclobacillus fastidiosus]WAH43277.1 NO-inducible flavohemoprotein [Alicyclobacillus fastidiosus]GMA65324.1 flavohemoprotein [Alicyclobacillus fastidiosus]